MDQYFDVMENIFSRLPIKSLLTWKCVCKHWYSTISDIVSSSNFRKLHAVQTKKNPELRSQSILISSPTAAIDYSTCLSNKDDIQKAWKNRHTPGIFGKIFTLMGSFYGLICLHDKLFNVFLWNPCTESFITVKKNYCNKERNPFLFYGFGPNLSTGCYVVILGCPFFYCDREIKSGYRDIRICVMNNEHGRYVWKFILSISDLIMFLKKLVSLWTEIFIGQHLWIPEVKWSHTIWMRRRSKRSRYLIKLTHSGSENHPLRLETFWDTFLQFLRMEGCLRFGSWRNMVWRNLGRGWPILKDLDFMTFWCH